MKKIDQRNLPYVEKGQVIKLYGKRTEVVGLSVQYNEAFEQYEIILLTTFRGDPFLRTLDNIEIL